MFNTFDELEAQNTKDFDELTTIVVKFNDYQLCLFENLLIKGIKLSLLKGLNKDVFELTSSRYLTSDDIEKLQSKFIKFSLQISSKNDDTYVVEFNMKAKPKVVPVLSPVVVVESITSPVVTVAAVIESPVAVVVEAVVPVVETPLTLVNTFTKCPPVVAEAFIDIPLIAQPTATNPITVVEVNK